jgi:hypothetical protein
VRLEGLGKLKKSNDLIVIRTRDLPACRIVPQPTTLPRAPPRSVRRKSGKGEQEQYRIKEKKDEIK